MDGSNLLNLLGTLGSLGTLSNLSGNVRISTRSSSDTEINSENEGAFENDTDIFTKERVALMHKQLDVVTTPSRGVLFLGNTNRTTQEDIQDPHEACTDEEKQAESELLFSLLIAAIRVVLLGSCFTPNGSKIIKRLAKLPPMTQSKSILKMYLNLDKVHSVVVAVLQTKNEELMPDTLLDKYGDAVREYPLPEDYKGKLTNVHYWVLHSTIDRYLSWTNDSFVIKKNNYNASNSIGSIFWKILCRTMIAHIGGSTGIWSSLLIASKKGAVVIKQKEDNQAISNYGFIRAIMITDKNHFRRCIGERGVPVSAQN